MSPETAVQTQAPSVRRLTGKVAIVTGAAQGIGLAISDLFCREGASVVMVDIDFAAVEQSAKKLEASGARTLGLKADVTRHEDCEAVVKAALDKLGKIDILVNNAGITRDNLVLRMSEADWDLVLDVNLKGAFNFTKAALRPMLKAHSGRIVNIASIVGEEGNGGQANYSASKGGLIAMTKSCAREFASRNILVNAVAPGFIKTRLTEVIPEAEKAKLMNKILLGRMGEPIDVARAVLFLSCEESSYVTGHVLNVNGGGYM
ncbi:MAG: 3-oxoacyl-[acyl-carrier-protein] reductase [Elusimicrobia bacterium]|nr:3-oxoacyl-[acyl-carrier-protein] reductase [Elusimicrobiota bacterium]